MSWLDCPTEPAEESAPTEPAEESDLSGIDAFLSKWEEERTAPSDSVVTHKIMVTHKIFVSPGEDAFAAVDDYATSRGLYVVEQDDKLFLTDGSPDKLEPVETVETVETVEPDDLDPPDEEIWTF